MYFKSGEKACTGLNLKAISEGTGKVVKRVGVWGNPKAISGGTGKVVKRVGVWGNLKAKSGGMGKDFRILTSTSLVSLLGRPKCFNFF